MRKKRGFAAMTPEQRRQIAALGGKAAHREGRAHKWTRAEAREAGRKGGLASKGGGNQFTSESGRKAAAARERKRR